MATFTEYVFADGHHTAAAGRLNKQQLAALEAKHGKLLYSCKR